MQSALLAVFPEEQLKEIWETEVTELLEDVGKVEVLSLTQSELRNTVEEVDWETIDETKSGFKQGLNSSFDCLSWLNLDARLSISGSFKQFFLKLNWCELDYFSFFSESWVTMLQNDLTEILQAWRKYQMFHCDKTIFWSNFG